MEKRTQSGRHHILRLNLFLRVAWYIQVGGSSSEHFERASSALYPTPPSLTSKT